MSLRDAWKQLAEGSRRNCAAQDTLAESAQLALEDEEFEDMIPIYAAASISDDNEDGIDDRNCYKALTESLLAVNWDTAMNQELDAIGQLQVFGDFVELLEGKKALPSDWVYIVLQTVPDRHFGSGSGSKPNHCQIGGLGRH